MENYIYGIGAILIMAAPVVYLVITRKRREAAFIKHFKELAAKENIHMDDTEIWNVHYAIGLDNGTKKLFYYKKMKEGEKTVAVDLANVESCRIATKSRSVKTTSGSSSVIDRIDLALLISGPQKTEKLIEFFNGEESLSLRGEPLIVEKWQGKINDALKKKKTVSR